MVEQGQKVEWGRRLYLAEALAGAGHGEETRLLLILEAWGVTKWASESFGKELGDISEYQAGKAP